MAENTKRRAKQALEIKLLEGLQSPASEMTDADWNDIEREALQRVQATKADASANAKESDPDPILGCMRDDADLMDKIVDDAYHQRRAESLQESPNQWVARLQAWVDTHPSRPISIDDDRDSIY